MNIEMNPELIQKYSELEEPGDLFSRISINGCLNENDTKLLINNTIIFMIDNYKRLSEQCMQCSKKDKCNY